MSSILLNLILIRVRLPIQPLNGVRQPRVGKPIMISYEVSVTVNGSVGVPNIDT